VSNQYIISKFRVKIQGTGTGSQSEVRVNNNVSLIRRTLGRAHYFRQSSLSDSSLNMCFCCACMTLIFDLELLQLTQL